jgi:Fe-S cluster assembly protein SufD
MTLLPQDAAAVTASPETALSPVETFARLRESPPLPGPAWLAPLRDEGFRRFEALGLPTTRQEAWRFTSLAPLAKLDLAPPSSRTPDAAAIPTFPGSDLLVFSDGCFVPELSSVSSEDGLFAGDLRGAQERFPEELERAFGSAVDGAAEGLPALNLAFVGDGAVVRIPAKRAASRPIHLAFLSSGGPSVSARHPRILVMVEEGAEARLVESWDGPVDGGGLTNAVAEILVGAGASLEHVKIEKEGNGAFHLATTGVRQARASFYRHVLVSAGSLLSRNDLRVRLEGEGAECRIFGLTLADGLRHVDHQTFVDHVSPHGTSFQLDKGVLDGNAGLVFSGRVAVRKDAQKSDAKQSSRNLLLSENATVNSRPQLEILADDVKCTHGATVGQLEENAMFYLRSRGIDPASARELLVFAFASEVLSQISIPEVRRRVEETMLGGIPVHLGFDEVAK